MLMLKSKFIYFILLFLSLITPSHAENKTYDAHAETIKNIQQERKECFENDQKHTTLSMTECAGFGTKRLDALMNIIWKDIKTTVKNNPDYFTTKNPFDSLLNAQRNWLKYRTSKCEFLSNFSGTMYRPIIAECYYDENLARTKELNGYLSFFIE